MASIRNLLGATARHRRQLGLRLATEEETYGPYGPLRREVRSLAASGRLRDVEAMWDAAWHSQERLPDGHLLYGSILRWVSNPDKKDAARPEPFLSAFEAEYLSTPTPFWGAVYANALDDIAGLRRGKRWGHEVTRAQWQGYDEMKAHAAHVLSESADNGATTNFAWCEMAHLLTLSGHLDGDAEDTWVNLLSCAPTDLNLLGARGVQLLPRWYGSSSRDAERFARQAMEATRDQYGTGAYSAVMVSFANIGSLDPEDVHIDEELLRKSYEDLLVRFPGSVEILNNYANTMWWLGNDVAVWHIYSTHGLRAIIPSAWGGHTDRIGMAWAVDSFQTARTHH